MKTSKEKEASIIRDYLIKFVSAQTRTFGGSRSPGNNIIAMAMADSPPMFAAGVDVGEVVDLVLVGVENAKKALRSEAHKARRKANS